MDLDRFIDSNRPSWKSLAGLSKRVHRKPASLRPEEVDKFVALYNKAATQLSYARGQYHDPALNAELNTVVASANAALYRRTSSPAAALRRFFTLSFPAALWHIRKFVTIATLVTVIPWLAVSTWLGYSDQALNVAFPEEARDALVNEEFESYYSSEPASQFATEVLINNIRVSFLAFALGITLCLGSVFILALNGINVGLALGAFIAAGQQAKFWGLILPHGFLELTAVFIAGAAGMSMGWAIISPGDRKRAVAFSVEARRSVVVIMGLMLMFVIAAVIEAVVTPSGLPTLVRVGFGLAVELAFLSYVFSYGRRAAAAGLTGLASEELEGESAASALAV